MRKRRLARAGAVILAALTCAAIATVATVQQGGLRIAVLSQIKPYKLPRDKLARSRYSLPGTSRTPKAVSRRTELKGIAAPGDVWVQAGSE